MSTAHGHHDHVREAQAVKARRQHSGGGTRKQNKGLIVGLIIMVLIIGAIMGYLFLAK